MQPTQGVPSIQYTWPEPGHTTGKLTIIGGDSREKTLSVKNGAFFGQDNNASDGVKKFLQAHMQLSTTPSSAEG